MEAEFIFPDPFRSVVKKLRKVPEDPMSMEWDPEQKRIALRAGPFEMTVTNDSAKGTGCPVPFCCPFDEIYQTIRGEKKNTLISLQIGNGSAVLAAGEKKKEIPLSAPGGRWQTQPSEDAPAHPGDAATAGQILFLTGFTRRIGLLPENAMVHVYNGVWTASNLTATARWEMPGAAGAGHMAFDPVYLRNIRLAGSRPWHYAFEKERFYFWMETGAGTVHISLAGQPSSDPFFEGELQPLPESSYVFPEMDMELKDFQKEISEIVRKEPSYNGRRYLLGIENQDGVLTVKEKKVGTINTDRPFCLSVPDFIDVWKNDMSWAVSERFMAAYKILGGPETPSIIEVSFFLGDLPAQRGQGRNEGGM